MMTLRDYIMQDIPMDEAANGMATAIEQHCGVERGARVLVEVIPSWVDAVVVAGSLGDEGKFSLEELVIELTNHTARLRYAYDRNGNVLYATKPEYIARD